MKNELQMLLAGLARPPYSGQVLAHLSGLCNVLLELGSALEKECCEELDLLGILMAQLCSDTSVEIQLRLAVLEILELRSLGWKRSPDISNYYEERVEQARSQTAPRNRGSTSVNMNMAQWSKHLN